MLSDDAVRLTVILQIVRRRWRLLTVLATVGALLGVGTSLLFSPGYESTSSVLLQGPLEEQELQTEAQIATSSVVLDRTAAALASDVTGAELRDSVSAEVVDGNVIEISGTADTPDRAQQLTNRATQEYVGFSTELVRRATGASTQALATLQQRITDTNRRLTELQESAMPAQGGTELEQLRTTLADAITALEEISGGEQADAAAAFGKASILVLEPARRPSSPAQPAPVQFIAAGALLFFLLGVFTHLVAARADLRLRTASDIAAALGSPVMGSVDVPNGPGEPAANERSAGARGWRARMWRLVRDDRPWDTPELSAPGNDLDRDVRYRRVLARLRGAPDTVLRLVVLVADDDAAAHRAAARLAVAAAVDGGPASVVTDRAAMSQLIQAARDRAGASDVQLSIRSSSDPAPGTHRTMLRVVDVSGARPTIPDCGRVSGALLVLTAGTRTAWELVGIAEACTDAQLRVLGAFVAHRTLPSTARPTGDRPVETTQVGPSGASVDGKAMAGSA
ncbi:MAG: polysaccharide biosynthesis protein [Pseudonocardiaceae bacterium]|nr:polysaccharide biosynthesis protein [Pseudonocardiaceae bacterium]